MAVAGADRRWGPELWRVFKAPPCAIATIFMVLSMIGGLLVTGLWPVMLAIALVCFFGLIVGLVLGMS